MGLRWKEGMIIKRFLKQREKIQKNFVEIYYLFMMFYLFNGIIINCYFIVELKVYFIGLVNDFKVVWCDGKIFGFELEFCFEFQFRD